MRIDGDRLTCEAWTADDRLYDAFVLQKDAEGRKQLVKGPLSTMDPRRFANTAACPGSAPDD